MSISPTADDYRSSARLIVALLDEDSDLSLPEIIAVEDTDEACRRLFACALIAAGSIQAASAADTAQIGLAVHYVAEALADRAERNAA